MLSSISKFSDASSAYAAQSVSAPKIPTALQDRPVYKAVEDSYERADGSTATRGDAAAGVKVTKTEAVESDDEKKFRELLHQFVGQVLFGQMLKSMRATQEKNPYFHGGRAEEIFQSQLDMVLTDKMSAATSKTLSDPMYKLMRAPKAAS